MTQIAQEIYEVLSENREWLNTTDIAGLAGISSRDIKRTIFLMQKWQGVDIKMDKTESRDRYMLVSRRSWHEVQPMKLRDMIINVLLDCNNFITADEICKLINRVAVTSAHIRHSIKTMNRSNYALVECFDSKYKIVLDSVSVEKPVSAINMIFSGNVVAGIKLHKRTVEAGL